MSEIKKIKLYCIKKIYDKNGKITKYVLGDEFGYTEECDRTAVIDYMKSKEYEVVNLQLDKTRRIVDKPIKNEDNIVKEITKRSKTTDLSIIFDDAYKLITEYDRLIMFSKFEDGELYYTEPFENLINKLSIEQLQSKFESYIMQKYKVKLTKLTVLHKSGELFIEYGLPYIGFTYLYKDSYFNRLDSIKNYKISCNSGDMYNVIKKIATVRDKKVGGIVEDAFFGIIVYDKRNEEAADFAKKQCEELEKEISKIRYTKKTTSNEKLQALKKSSGQSGFFKSLLDIFKR